MVGPLPMQVAARPLHRDLLERCALHDCGARWQLSSAKRLGELDAVAHVRGVHGLAEVLQDHRHVLALAGGREHRGDFLHRCGALVGFCVGAGFDAYAWALAGATADAGRVEVFADLRRPR